MALETKPRRQRLPYPAAENGRHDQSTGVGGQQTPPEPPPPTPVAPPSGPSWGGFLLTQTSLLLAISLIFGAIALTFIARAGNTSGTTAVSEAPAATAVATTAAAATPVSTPTAVPVPASAARLPQPKVAAPVGQRAPQTVPVTLEVQETVALVDDGIAYEYWTFGGTVPGPMIRVRQGDTVEVTLKNAPTNKAAHSIDLHAVTGPGGGSDVTLIAPGESKTFRFQAQHPGVFVYQSASTPVSQQVSSGMYGLIVVEPPQGLPKVDREFYVMQGELYLEGQRADKGLRTFSDNKALDEQPDYIVFNGSVGALTDTNALKAKTGETVRIFFGVGGPNLVSSFRVVGAIFDRVAVEGAALDDPTKWATHLQTTAVPAGGATLVEFKVDVPGRYPLTDGSLGRETKGAIATLIIEGAENPGVFSPQH